MIRPIQKDIFFLRKKAVPVGVGDLAIADDLRETLFAHAHECVGMAANMIGFNKSMIGFFHEGAYMEMLNPRMISKAMPYETEEGCLSLVGVRKTTRYENIEVEYYDMQWKKQRIKLSGWPAQICQHECDHLNGIII